MIWIFDSGSGGLTLLNEARKLLPEYDFLYFWDYQNCPYGNKTRLEIFDLTKKWVQKLEKAGAKLIILACNTATWAAIRALQADDDLKNVKILWVTIPGAECVVEENFKKIAVFATQASAKNNLYKERVHILDNSVSVTEIWMPNLAWNIEQFLQQQKKEQEIFDEIFSEIKNIDTDSEAIVLGCTHYSHVKNIFEKIFPKQKIICPSEESAKKLKKYLQKHTEIDKNLSKNGKVLDISEK